MALNGPVTDYVVYGTAVVVGSLATILASRVLKRHSATSITGRAMLATVCGILILGLYAFGISSLMRHRIIVPPNGVDETVAAVFAAVSLIFGAPAALLAGVATAFCEKWNASDAKCLNREGKG